MAEINPTTCRLSEHFLLSDFMGSSSIYEKGLSNILDTTNRDERLRNGRALCENLLEPILAVHGPMSVSYGFISPSVSRALVSYMNPDGPSYHRWDAGAACDILVHDAIHGGATFEGSPIALAHAINAAGFPYSRLISYAESPYLCIAARASEIEASRPRRAFYENRYEGKKGAKPRYINMSSGRAAAVNALEALRALPEFHWKGAGYPTYHNGGTKKMHHIRISRYTMASDWLFDQNTVAEGISNIPALTRKGTMRAFLAAGKVYDNLIRVTGCKRLSIIQGFLCDSARAELGQDGHELADWEQPTIGFWFVPPAGAVLDCNRLQSLLPGVTLEESDGAYLCSFEVEHVQNTSWQN